MYIKQILLLFLIIWNSQALMAQKSLIDSTTYNKWPVLEGQSLISSNGKFIAYDIKQGSVYGKSLRFVIQSTQNNWKIEIKNGLSSPAIFTRDSRYCVFISSSDSLGLLNLISGDLKYISGVSNFTITELSTENRLIYLLKDTSRTTVIRNLRTNEEQKFSNLNAHWVSDNGKAIILLRSSEKNNIPKQSLQWLNLQNGKIISFWKGEKAENIVTNFEFNQLSFKTRDSILYYKLGMSKPVCLLSSKDTSLNSEYTPGTLGEFSQDGTKLFINLDLKAAPEPYSENCNVEIWSYTDVKLPCEQELEHNLVKSFKAIVKLDDRKIVKLQQYSNEHFSNLNNSANWVLSSYKIGDGGYGEDKWNKAAQRGFDLLNINDGTRKKLEFLSNKINLQFQDQRVKLSPGSKYIVYYDLALKDYYCYDIDSAKLKNITNGCSNSWLVRADTSFFERGIVGWLPNDEALLVYDAFDIWKIDPRGSVRPVNITNGYGQNHKITFHLATNSRTKELIQKNALLILTAFNGINKENGFFKKGLNEVGDPHKLSMGSYVYKTDNGYVPVADFIPLKASQSKVFLVKRQSATEAPNYFLTSDFKEFKQLTNLQPQINYNWYRAELHNWNSKDGQIQQGILYKPEDFDPNKHYPVIFYQYEILSDGLNAYLEPEFSSGNLNIPTYVSNGYLVFCPDIKFKTGSPMQSSYEAMISATNYVSSLSFVDKTKMGIQGHSFGAIQTNYFLTRSNVFAAACSASGNSDWVSGYGSLFGNHDEGFSSSLQFNFENGQLRMGTSLWENFGGYLKNSAILRADKIMTPILMMHTKKDKICPYQNVMEFFLGLRRLGKKAWLLSYPEGSHSLSGKESIDFSTRMMQFFDHYLKGKPVPIWMLDDQNTRQKSLNYGFRLDQLGRTPGQGLLTPAEQRKWDSLQNREPVVLTLE